MLRSGHLHLTPFLLLALLLFTGVPALAATPEDLALEFVIEFDDVVAITHAGDGSNRLFLVEQAGRIQVLHPDGTSNLFLDINARVSSGGERGLLGLAFHPDFASNQQFFVYYTESTSPPPECPLGADCRWNSVIERYEVTGVDPDMADTNSDLRILTFNQDYSNHNGGAIHFGPDGYLYIGTGDGGSGGDPQDRSQSLDTLLGKMLRIDIDPPIRAPERRGGASPCGAAVNYSIPVTNPLLGTVGACSEIWAYGLRNPWRWSFDRRTGDLWIGDVGQNAVEEIDFAPATSTGGENYGWSCMEGNNTPNFNSCDGAPLTAPVWTYGHGAECSVTGGHRYRGSNIAGFDGTYVYGDYCSGRIWFLTSEDEVTWNNSEWMDTSFLIPTFGEGEDGELYLAESGGEVYRFTSPSTVFVDGFESGDTTAWDQTIE